MATSQLIPSSYYSGAPEGTAAPYDPNAAAKKAAADAAARAAQQRQSQPAPQMPQYQSQSASSGGVRPATASGSLAPVPTASSPFTPHATTGQTVNNPQGYSQTSDGVFHAPTQFGPQLQAINALSGMGLFGSGSSSSSSSGSATAPKVPNVQGPDTRAANAATFARAKDQAGETARGALTGLRSQLAGRGMLGSGMEAKVTGNIIGKGAQGLNEVTRSQAIQDVNTTENRANQTYAGDITQRGQDLNAQQAEFNRQAQMRSQQSQQQAKMLQGLLGSMLPGGLSY